VDGPGRVLFGNPAAEALVRRGVLAQRGGHLSVRDEAVAGRFAAALASVRSQGAKASGDGAVIVLACPDPAAPSGVARYAAHVLALPPPHPFRAVAPRATACVQVIRLDGEAAGAPALDPGVLMEAFDLTPREARLAVFVGSGGSLDAAGRAFGTSRNTLRAQLQAVFEKTGARRQAELVRLVRDLASLRA
jgi:DNA-binding CsgD family transcriptional regulator